MPKLSQHKGVKAVHIAGIARALQLCDLHAYQIVKLPASLDLSDLLRSAVMMAFSSLDLMVHSLYRDEVRHRFANGQQISGLKVPFNSIVANANQAIQVIEADIFNSHSYKSFIAPDKIAEVLCHFVATPWRRISDILSLPEDIVKSRLKELVRWRNRIAHESDINPALGGIELWPVSEADVRDALHFINDLGLAIVSAVEDN